MQNIYKQIVEDLISYRTGSLHPFVSKNTKRGGSWNEPTMQHFQKIINKYADLARSTEQNQ